MTHDELLAKIDIHWATETIEQVGRKIKALRAVVELHNPKDEIIGMGVTFEGVTTSLNSKLRCACGQLYPCRTIEAIEKELG
jgi:hypothetical protein